jgi:hypothetical protein
VINGLEFRYPDRSLDASAGEVVASDQLGVDAPEWAVPVVGKPGLDGLAGSGRAEAGMAASPASRVAAAAAAAQRASSWVRFMTAS